MVDAGGVLHRNHLSCRRLSWCAVGADTQPGVGHGGPRSRRLVAKFSPYRQELALVMQSSARSAHQSCHLYHCSESQLKKLMQELRFEEPVDGT